ncbi:endonuclease/exonuclease/phosphatase family protein [Yoonia sp. 208BN28-4]|uniref:endonuclease/exonuclease/phosphatase family protein n=1 Tax=Yoonia sp. 208BN28-4 TaxID=3126505 RepID=UPI0030AD8459
MRLATYNVEWFNTLFNDDGSLRDDDGWSGRWDVTRAQQIAALGTVFQAMDADAIMIIEAPDTSRHRSGVRALDTFAERFGLRARNPLIGFPNETQQEIALLYDPDKMTARHDPLGEIDQSSAAPRFDMELRMDIDVDARPDIIRWSKPPLEVALDVGGKPLRLIGVHAKSKAPHGARDDAEASRISIQNRRKQLAQCIWLRQRVNQHLEAGEDLIVAGDFNDGPGLDEYEKLFGRSGVEIVLGEGDATPLFDPHAQMALSRRMGAIVSTARFKQRGGPYLQALLDYVMVSPRLRAQNPAWQIWHPFDHPACYENKPLRDALLLASDHFPVTLDLTM